MKQWLTDRFLPMWAKETVMKDNRLLRKENRCLKEKLRQMECYAQGLETGIRSMRKIQIINREGPHENL